MTGLALALSEITLVVFTTLAPSGAVAIALACLAIIAGAGGGAVARLIRLLWVPILVTMVGLVASATHLGNPSNALYVLSGVGRSPLSTEVAAAVAFLAAAGSFWLYGFAEHPRRRLQKAWAAALVVLAVALVTSIAFAYSARTIPAWNTPFAPVSLWLGALTGGPVLALAVLRAAGYCEARPAAHGRLPVALLALATVALAAGLGVGIAQGCALPSLHSSLTSADALVPHYWAMLATSGTLQAAGLALAWRTEAGWVREPSKPDATTDSASAAPPLDNVRLPGAARIPGDTRPPGTASSPVMHAKPSAATNPADTALASANACPAYGTSSGSVAHPCDEARKCVPSLALACILIFAGLFVTRFAFYMMHLTSGL